MSISCQALYESVRDTIGLGSGNEKLVRTFVTAVNRTLDELSITADLASPHTHISGVEDTISTLATRYEWILSSGVAFYMTRLGQRPSDPNLAQIVYRDTAHEWERAKGEYVADRWNDCQAVDSSDIIAGGYLGADGDS